MAKPLQLEAGWRTDLGKRRDGNEDAFAVDRDASVFVVCDGIGGAPGGEIASRMAAHAILERCARPHLAKSVRMVRTAIETANDLVFGAALAQPRLRGMGTTAVVLVLENDRAIIAHVGDSRCYRLRDGVLQQLTTDHSLVEEQVRAGVLSRAEAERSPMQNVITRAVGTAPEVEVDVREERVQPGDVFLLATDGLTREVNDTRIGETLGAPDHPDAICACLILLANVAGGSDNITCVVVRIANDASNMPERSES